MTSGVLTLEFSDYYPPRGNLIPEIPWWVIPHKIILSSLQGLLLENG